MSEETSSKGGCSWLTVLIVLGLVGVGAAIAVPNLLRVNMESAEAYSIGALKTIATSESIFREGDKENDGNLDFGMLSELEATHLIDPVLGSGTKQGYVFVAAYSPTTSEFLWFALARPDPRRTDINEERSLFTNIAGTIFYTTSPAPIPVNPETCEIRSDLTTVTPIGK